MISRWLRRGRSFAGRGLRYARRRLGVAPTAGRTSADSPYPRSYRVQPRPGPVSDGWPEPPAVERPSAVLEPGPDAPAPIVYDLALFEQLNAEYASRPIVPEPPKYDHTSVADRSRRRIANLHDRIGLAGLTVLEIGCGSGFEVWYLGSHLGADAWGIDVLPRQAWPSLEGPRVHLVAGDIASHPLPSDTFDRVISYTVWEHVRHPYAALEQVHRVLKPGGLSYMVANLYRGPTASHRYRHVTFPFPHLLFADDVFAAGMERAGGPRVGADWVNKLTWEQYEAAFREIGFRIKSVEFKVYPLDEAFYQRFEDVLGRYPRRDLERGFFTAILEKPRRRFGRLGRR